MPEEQNDELIVDTAELLELPLHDEHLNLGAHFSDFGPYLIAYDYGPVETIDDDLDHPLLTDVTYQGLLRVSGQDAYRFLQTMCTADALSLDGQGDHIYGLVLTGDAEIIDLVEIVKTGSYEFLVISDAPHTEELYEWLDAHAHLDDEQGPVFPDLEISNETGVLGQFVLIGAQSFSIIEALIGTDHRHLTHDGSLYMIEWEGTPLMIVEEQLSATPALRIFFPIAASISFWRILLSFPELQIIGRKNYERFLLDAGILLPDSTSSGYLTPGEAQLEHLLRIDRDFVGAHNLEDIK
jgi:glycine cleavage system aminomethyltransferase T